MPQPDKTCATCGRRFSWRRKWADEWDRVRYCSAGCRRQKPQELDRRLEKAIVRLSSDGPIRPEEVVRAVADDRVPLERARRAGRRLAAAGRIVVVQDGRSVDPSAVKGPIAYVRVR